MLNKTLQPELKTGTVLKETDTEYTITEVLAHGGFSIVYEAETDKGDTVVIKEIFPNTGDFYRNKNQIVWSFDTLLADRYRKIAEREYQYGKELATRSSSGRMIVLQRPLKIEKINDFSCGNMTEGYYYLLESVKGKGVFLLDFLKEIETFNEKHEPYSRIYITTNIIYQILCVLKDIHDAGFIHGDLSFTNLFVNDPELEKGSFGTISILDFGATHRVEDLTGSYEIDASTPMNLAPEVRQKKPDISYSSDIYSIGMMMWDLLFHNHTESKRRNNFSDKKRDTFISPSTAAQLGCRNREEYRLLSTIMRCSTNEDPAQRYCNATAMLLDVSTLLDSLSNIN